MRCQSYVGTSTRVGNAFREKRLLAQTQACKSWQNLRWSMLYFASKLIPQPLGTRCAPCHNLARYHLIQRCNRISPGEGTWDGNKRRSSRQKFISGCLLENLICVTLGDIQFRILWNRKDLVNKPVLLSRVKLTSWSELFSVPTLPLTRGEEIAYDLSSKPHTKEPPSS